MIDLSICVLILCFGAFELLDEKKTTLHFDPPFSPSPGPPGMAFPRPKTKRNGFVSVPKGVERLRLTLKSQMLSFYLVQKFLEDHLRVF